MSHLAALAIATALAGGPDPLVRADGQRLPDEAQRGAISNETALVVQAGVGLAECGLCGIDFGVAAALRTPSLSTGVFVEVAAVPIDPSESAPGDRHGTTFLGAHVGAKVHAEGRLRIELGAELGFERPDLTEYSPGSERRIDDAWAPFAGARVKAEIQRRRRGRAAFGVAAFVRQPLRSVCVDAGEGCERVRTAVGVVLHWTFAVARWGTAPRVVEDGASW